MTKQWPNSLAHTTHTTLETVIPDALKVLQKLPTVFSRFKQNVLFVYDGRVWRNKCRHAPRPKLSAVVLNSKWSLLRCTQKRMGPTHILGSFVYRLDCVWHSRLWPTTCQSLYSSSLVWAHSISQNIKTILLKNNFANSGKVAYCQSSIARNSRCPNSPQPLEYMPLVAHVTERRLAHSFGVYTTDTVNRPNQNPASSFALAHHHYESLNVKFKL